MKENPRNFIAVSFFIVLLTAINFAPLTSHAAEPPSLDDFIIENRLSNVNDTLQMNPISELSIDENKDVIDITSYMQGESIPNIPSDMRMNVGGRLFETTDIKMHFFSVTKDAFLIASMSSAPGNNYLATLYILDYDTKTAIPSNITGTISEIMSLSNLPTGHYAIGITISDEVSSMYSMNINVMNPAGDVLSYQIPNTNNFVAHYSDNKIYVNGTYICTAGLDIEDNENEHLNWERLLIFDHGGQYRYRLHKITSARVTHVSRPIRYSSFYATANPVVLIYLDVDTEFEYKFQARYFENPPRYESSTQDMFGKECPRLLDLLDFAESDHVLVYDLTQQRTIDFYSPLNYYYFTGEESLPEMVLNY